MERRDDRFKRLDPRRSINYVRQGLQHLRVSVGVVLVCVVLVFPQTDGDRFLAAGTRERDFILEALLLAQQRKDLVLKSTGVIRLHIGFQAERDIACVHIQPPKGCIAYKKKRTSDGLTYIQGT